MIVINVPELPKTPSTLMHKNASFIEREKSRWVWLVRRYNEFKTNKITKAKLILTRMSCKDLPEQDLQGSFELPLRALKKTDILDANAELEIEYRWEKSKRDYQGIRIELIAS